MSIIYWVLINPRTYDLLHQVTRGFIITYMSVHQFYPVYSHIICIHITEEVYEDDEGTRNYFSSGCLTLVCLVKYA